MNEPNLPYRFRESAFRNYENMIAVIMSHYPNVYWFTPSNVETFSCRLRDAMNSWRENKWTSDLNLHEFCKMQIRVAIRGSRVIVGHPDAVKATFRDPLPSGIHQEPAHLVVTNPSDPDLLALLQLHHSRILTNPTLIHFDHPFSPEPYEQKFDVAFEKTGEGEWKVI